MQKNHFAALDGLRGVAAMAVVATHGWLILGHQQIPHGYLAVDFFFVLSGFVVAFAYEDRIRSGAMGFWRFVQLRAMRLWPMILLGSLLGTISVALAYHPLPTTLAAAAAESAFTLPSPVHGKLGFSLWPVNPPSWSLFWEILANAMFALVGARLRTGWIIAFALCGGLALVPCALHFHTMELGVLIKHVGAGAARVAFSFSLGHIFYRFYKRGWLPRLRANIWFLSALAMGVFAFPMRGAMIDMGAVFVVLPAIILVALFTPAPGPIWRWAGNLSYPLYLVHYPLLVVLMTVWRPQTLEGKEVFYGAFLVAAVVASAIAFVAFDRPVRAALAGLRLRRPVETHRSLSLVPAEDAAGG